MRVWARRMLMVLLLAASSGAGTYEAPLDVRKETVNITFNVAPVVQRVAPGENRWKISFAVSGATDVEVAVLGADGKVARHLAAGLLGKNAPLPFKPDALAQELTWGRNG